jgi:hypothetical protein
MRWVSFVQILNLFELLYEKATDQRASQRNTTDQRQPEQLAYSKQARRKEITMEMYACSYIYIEYVMLLYQCKLAY